MSATNGTSNGSTPSEVDVELQICEMKDKILSLVNTEEVFRELKNNSAAEYRTQIKAVRDERVKLQKQLTDLQNGVLETEGTVIIQNAEPTKATA